MHIFIITSTLKAVNGVFTYEQRYEQTLKTIESIRNKAEGSTIIMIDSSPVTLDDSAIQTFKSKCDYFIHLFNHDTASQLSKIGHKSPAECYIMLIALDVIKNLNLENVQRVFKITGRGELSDNFHIEDYNNPEMKGKYVFHTPLESWMSPHLKLLITRLWSFDYPMLDEVVDMIRQAFHDTLPGKFDLEHTYYNLIEDKEKIYSKNPIGCKCLIASTGEFVDE